MKITKWDAQAPRISAMRLDITTTGKKQVWACSTAKKEAVANYIAGYVRMAFEGQMLYATSERGEGYIAYTLPGQKMNLKAGMAILKALFRNMSLKEMIRMGKALSKGGKIPSGSNEEREERFYIRRHGLRPRTIPGTGIHEESS